jgi:cobalt/nickel transport system permease protein
MFPAEATDLHHVVVERWSRGQSWMHARDARAKLIAALALVLAIATSPARHYTGALCYAAFVVAITLVSRLPLYSIALRAALVLPFSAAFAAASWLSGDLSRAGALLWRSYLSAFTVLLLVSTTPLVQLFRALEWFRVPGLIILVAQFLYRYLFVISEQAQHMRLAAQCRGGQRRTGSFRGAASALSVLFVRSYARADGIQKAMMARGFRGQFPALTVARFTRMDVLFSAAAITLCALIRLTA